MQHYEHLHRITDTVSIICSFFQRQKTTQFSLYTINFYHFPRVQFFGSWFSSWCSRGVTAEIHKSEKDIMLFSKGKKKKKEKSKVKGNPWSFITISLAEGARDICHFNSTASPSDLSLALLQIQQFPKLFFKVNAVEMMDEKNTVQRRNYVPLWSHEGTRQRQHQVLVLTLVTNAAETCHHRTQLLPSLWLWQTQGIRLRLKM